jgi:hypothetical protein
MKFIITEEQNEKLNQKVKSMVNKYGFEYTLEFFDNKDIIKHAYQDNPSEFLDQFNDLTPVEDGDGIYYVDEDGSPLFMYYPDRINGIVYIDFYRIWLFFSEIIGMEYKEIQGIMKNWLGETYNIKGLTPRKSKLS